MFLVPFCGFGGFIGKKNKKKKIDLQEKPSFDNPFSALKGDLDLPDTGIEIVDSPGPKSNFDRGSLRFHLQKERKNRRGKTVTVIGGLSTLPELEREDLRAHLKKALGVGAFWEEDDLVVQGDVQDRIKPALERWQENEADS